MAEVRRAEQRHALEDLMYVCILEKFQVGDDKSKWVMTNEPMLGCRAPIPVRSKRCG